jgi:3-dehydroquinate synthase
MLNDAEITITSGLIKNPLAIIENIKCSSLVLLSDSNVQKVIADDFAMALNAQNYKCLHLTFPAGEQYKTRETKAELEDKMLFNGIGLDTCLIAMGGGVTTDIAGFIAASYGRGITLINIPTTLLGMVDAAIGGKNGVNTPFGKNMIGTLYQPKKIIIDTDCLESLPVKELKNGLVEVIKHALIADSLLFEYLEIHVEELLAKDKSALERVIQDSCRIKLSIVEQEVTHKGIRNFLNFGHTIGHALENITHYTHPHGEAVAIGILVESHIAYYLGCFDEKKITQILNLFQQFGIALELPDISIDALLEAMMLDKKAIDKSPRFCIIEDIGKMSECNLDYCKKVDKSLIIKSLNRTVKLIKENSISL